MNKRKQQPSPFQQHLQRLIIVYNFSMVILSAYLFYEFLVSGWLFDYTLGCQTVDYSTTNPKALRMAHACWLFYISKFIELLDTVFFILKQKTNQVTFLHVFHHGIMPVSWWFAVKLAPGGFTTFHALLNSLIHFFMYIYYALAALGDKYKKYTKWKQWMTRMQMIQFVLVMIHSGQLLLLENCAYPKLFVAWIGLYALVFMAFFANFYIQEYYVRSSKSAATVSTEVKKKK
jgi:elongation of very long chain fatty acids protein 7